jgi:two-component system sensor histidine kinase UhpB
MSNALRHGQAKTLVLRLGQSQGWLALELVDDGRGLATQPAEGTSHHGLRWMRERAEALGGHCTLEPREGGGMRLLLRLPAAPAAPAGASEERAETGPAK